MNMSDLENLGWTPVVPAYNWEKYGLEVVGDRYLENGRRQHLVKNDVMPGLALDNADIFGLSQANLATHKAKCPCFQKKFEVDGKLHVEAEITIILRNDDDSIRVRFSDMITTKPHTALWERGKSKIDGECAVSGKAFKKGDEIYRPVGGMPYRAKRILAEVIDQISN